MRVGQSYSNDFVDSADWQK